MRIFCFSDTHRRVERLDVGVVDVIVCAGDFCNSGSLGDIATFNRWFSKLPCQHKIVVAGNHDVCLETNPSLAKSLLDKNIIYLQDQEAVIQGVKFYGSPWQLPFMNWAFNLPEEELAEKFSRMPDDVDILITHSPPHGILDGIPTQAGLGSRSLLKKVYQIKPMVHIFGHIHDSYGKFQDKKHNITFLNVSLLNEEYQFVNKPVVFEI